MLVAVLMETQTNLNLNSQLKLKFELELSLAIREFKGAFEDEKNVIIRILDQNTSEKVFQGIVAFSNLDKPRIILQNATSKPWI